MKFLTKKQIFNKVKNHLLTQNRQCVSTNGITGLCKYRSGNLKCAIGALIPDELYCPEIEDVTLSDPELEKNPNKYFLLQEILYKSNLDISDPEIRKLIIELQTIHDIYEPLDWSYHLDILEKEMKG